MVCCVVTDQPSRKAHAVQSRVNRACTLIERLRPMQLPGHSVTLTPGGLGFPQEPPIAAVTCACIPAFPCSYLVTLGGLGHPGGVMLQVITGVGRHRCARALLSSFCTAPLLPPPPLPPPKVPLAACTCPVQLGLPATNPNPKPLPLQCRKPAARAALR